jgi:4-amino-4-deoxy-L-arabinose transferase-like glycosyltransferase
MNQHSRSINPTGTLTALGLSLVLTCFLMILMPATQLWDADEPVYARTAMEMLWSGNWLVPTFNGENFSHKPPFVYWLIAIASAVFGHGEFAARFFSAPAMGATAFLTFLIGRQLFSQSVGFWTMIMTSTGILAVYLGSAAMLDAPLVLFITLSIYAYIAMVYTPERYLTMLALFTFALSITTLIKGPVGPAVVCTCVLMSWLLMADDERPSFVKMIPLAISAIIAVAVYLAWAIPANIQTEGAFLRESIGIHVIGRALAPMEGHGGSGLAGYLSTFLIYIPVVIFGFLPWTIHLPAAFYGLFKGTIGDRRARAIIWGWLVPTFLMFTFAATKLPHYIFPIWPALALIASAILVKTQDQGIGLVPWSRMGAWLYLILSPGLAAILLVGPFYVPHIISFWVGIPMGLIVIIATTHVFRTHMMGRVGLASKWLAVASPFIYVFVFWVVVPPVEPYIKVSKDIAIALDTYDLPNDKIYIRGYNEYSLKYYINLPTEFTLKTMPMDQAGLDEVLAQTGKIVLIANSPDFDRIAALENGDNFKVLERFSARNLNSSAREQVLVLAVRE